MPLRVPLVSSLVELATGVGLLVALVVVAHRRLAAAVSRNLDW